VAEEPHLEAALLEGAAQAGSLVSPAVKRDLVHLVVEPRVRGNRQDERPPGRQRLAQRPQGSDVVVDVLQDVEHAEKVVSPAERRRPALVHPHQGHVEPRAHEPQALGVDVARARHRDPVVAEEVEQASASTADVEQAP